MRQAKSLIVKKMETAGRTRLLTASLFGCTMVSSSVLKGEGGCKVTYSPGVEKSVRVFLTDGFKDQWPALTLVVREACARGRGWQAVNLATARKKDGWKWGLVLKSDSETLGLPAVRCTTKLQVLTGDEFVAWATKEFVLQDQSAWIKGR